MYINRKVTKNYAFSRYEIPNSTAHLLSFMNVAFSKKESLLKRILLCTSLKKYTFLCNHDLRKTEMYNFYRSKGSSLVQ